MGTLNECHSSVKQSKVKARYYDAVRYAAGLSFRPRVGDLELTTLLAFYCIGFWASVERNCEVCSAY